MKVEDCNPRRDYSLVEKLAKSQGSGSASHTHANTLRTSLDHALCTVGHALVHNTVHAVVHTNSLGKHAKTRLCTLFFGGGPPA